MFKGSVLKDQNVCLNSKNLKHYDEKINILLLKYTSISHKKKLMKQENSQK